MSYTKGTWNVSKIANNYDQYSIYADHANELIACSVEGKANAKLISATPDLLEACQFIVDASMHEEDKDLIKMAIQACENAISKAKL